MNMPKSSSLKTSARKRIAFLAVFSFLGFGVTQALPSPTTFSFDPAAATNTPWFSTNWSTSGAAPYTADWVNGNNTTPSIASFSLAANRVLSLNQNNISFGAGGGIEVLNGSQTAISGGGNPTSNIDFSGAVLRTVGGGTIAFSNNITPTGNFSVSRIGAAGSAAVVFSTTTPYSGTITLNANTYTNTPGTAGTGYSTASNFILDGGTIFALHTSGLRALGNVNMNGGFIELGPSNSAGTPSLSITQLTGATGTIRPRGPVANNNGYFGTFIIDQTTNTSFGGTIVGSRTSGLNTTRAELTKQGTGNLTLTGVLTSVQNVRVEGGGLWVSVASDAVRSFSNELGGAGSAALTVANGGTFGGNFTGARTLTIVGDRNVVVESGGRLSPGLVDGSGNPTIGLLRISFPDGGAVDLTDAVGNTGWLRFDLGANTTAGTTYDQINMTSGTLLIGNSLKFSDFQFTPTTGFDVGTYTLFSLTGTSALSGTLAGSGLTGNITGLYAGTLSLSGNNILLTIAAIPEPRASLLLLGGVVLWFMFVKRRRIA